MIVHRTFICSRCKNEEECRGKEPPFMEFKSKKSRITQLKSYIQKHQEHRKECLMGQLDWSDEEKRIELEDMDREATIWLENIEQDLEVKT